MIMVSDSSGFLSFPESELSLPLALLFFSNAIIIMRQDKVAALVDARFGKLWF